MKPQKLMKIGPYDCYSLISGYFKLDGGAMFGNVPKVLWEKHHRADEKNRIQMLTRNLLLKSEDENILVDVGNGGDFIDKYGPKLGSKFAEIFSIEKEFPSLEMQLEQLDLKPDDITDVILTHLHFDHAGGAVKFNPNTGKLEPSFPNASYVVQKENFEHASNPNIREKASYLSQNFFPLMEAGVLTLLSETSSYKPHIEFILSHGHTEGQQNVKISDGKQTLFYCADVIPLKAHLQPAWTMSYDINPILVIDEKIEILLKASKENWMLIFEHDPLCIGAQVQFEDGDKKPTIVNEIAQ